MAKWMLPISALAWLALGCTASAPVADAPAPSAKAHPLPGLNAAEDERHGAVLCSWMANLELKAIADICFPDSDAAVKAALNESIDRIDAFILTYSAATPAQIEQTKDQIFARAQRNQSLCQGGRRNDGLDVYRDFRGAFEKDPRAALEKSRAGLSQMLAVPRAPAMNPCL